MIDVIVHDRVVVVLGRGRVSVDPAVHVATAAGRGAPLLVLSLGYPVSEGQQAFVARAIDEAFYAGVRLDAQIVARPDGLAGLRRRAERSRVRSSLTPGGARSRGCRSRTRRGSAG